VVAWREALNGRRKPALEVKEYVLDETNDWGQKRKTAMRGERSWPCKKDTSVERRGQVKLDKLRG